MSNKRLDQTYEDASTYNDAIDKNKDAIDEKSLLD